MIERSKMRTLLLVLFVAVSSVACGQNGWKYNGNFNFGANITYVNGKGQHFPGIRFYAGFIANAVYKDHFILNYGPSISIYTKSLGANMNPLVNDIQVDFINSVSLGGGWDNISYYKFLRTVGNGSYYNVMLNQGYASLLTSNFIVNNHHHNQVNGGITFSTPWASLIYYNDGGWPFAFPFTDNFDRFWTGGLGLFAHNKQSYNTAELTFDQFTGYRPFLYELATKMGIDIPNYNLEDSTGDKIPAMFNTSAYNLKICPVRGFGVDVGVMGSLKTNGGKYFGIQEMIHTMGGYAMHPNYDVNRFYFGGSYNNFNHVGL
ncbi:MAG: hypothetical protein JWQ38_2154 [Flavipsychrobacter sp.]|nr:hypothetical protein [Flavipsychrobacter sp.]